MDANGHKKQLQEKTNSLFEEELLPSAPKQPNIPESLVLDQSPKEALTAAEALPGLDMEIQNADYEKAEINDTEMHGLEISPKEAFTAAETLPGLDIEIQKADYEKTEINDIEMHGLEISPIKVQQIECIKEDDSEDTKETLVGPKSSQTEVVDLLQKNKSITSEGFTSKIQSNVARSVPSSISRVDTEETAAKAIKYMYMQNYASEYSKELLFAVDVMTLTRYLNKLPCKWIIYVTSGDQPISPCDDTLEKALRILWERIKLKFKQFFETQVKTQGMNYLGFQQMTLVAATTIEQQPYDVEAFLVYCMIISEWTVCAERFGIQDAIEFTPLVICRTIQNLKNSGKISSHFWQEIALKAEKIVHGSK